MKKLIEIKYGSHLYGTDTESSDLDIKGIYLPEAKEIILGTYKETIQITRPKAHGERNTKDDIDVEYLSLDRFLKLLAEGQTMALDMLFAPEFILFDGYGITHEIWMNRDKLLNKNVNAFIGYARMQAAKYGIKGSRMDALKRVMGVLNIIKCEAALNEYWSMFAVLVKETSELVSLEKEPLIKLVKIPDQNGKEQEFLEVCNRKVPMHASVKTARDVYSRILAEYGARSKKANLAGGKDWKALSHAVRVNSEAIELLTTGKITMPRPEAQLLKQIKNGELPYEAVAAMIEEGLAYLLKVQATSDLREKPDMEWVDNFIFSVYSSIVKGEL